MSDAVNDLSPTLGLPMIDKRCDHEDSCKNARVYRMKGRCSNCRADLVGLFTAGHETSSYGPCPICGVHFSLGWSGLEDSQPAPPAVPVQPQDQKAVNDER